jgi:FkbM family methyltransferase
MNRIEFLKQKGFNPKTILDIGANVGDWTYDILKIYPTAEVLLFEANPNCELQLKLRYPNNKIFIGLLGNEEKKDVSFFINPKNNKCTGCSMMKELTYHYKNANEIKLDMYKLDNLVQQKVDLIKIDVQGAEKLVLEGAETILQNTDFIIMETNVLQYNEGSPLLSEMVLFMDKKGFQIYDCTELHHHEGYLIQIDFIFINKKSKYFPTLTVNGVEYNN